MSLTDTLTDTVTDTQSLGCPLECSLGPNEHSNGHYNRHTAHIQWKHVHTLGHTSLFHCCLHMELITVSPRVIHNYYPDESVLSTDWYVALAVEYV